MNRFFLLSLLYLSAATFIAAQEAGRDTVETTPDVWLGRGVTVPNPRPGVPGYERRPDGHVAFLRDGDEFQMYWAGRTTYRTRGSSVIDMSFPEPVLRAGPRGAHDDEGAWLYAVARQSDNNLIGFYHAEHHELDVGRASRPARKSIAVCTSEDNGNTWRKHGQIITSSSPRRPTWGGDFCVVWDGTSRRWLCFYQENHVCVAASNDQDGRPGTWKKYYDGGFTEPGIGGRATPAPGLEWHAGGNPSVHFNTFLKKWVMVWHTWPTGSPTPNSILLSSSDDLLHWTVPKVVLEAKGIERYWYPTILGESDVRAGEKALLCYAYFPDKFKDRRQFIVRRIVFNESR